MRFAAIFLLALLALQGFIVMAGTEDVKQHAQNAAGEIKEGAKDAQRVKNCF